MNGLPVTKQTFTPGNVFSSFTPQGGGGPDSPVKLQEWSQFHVELNKKLNLLFAMCSVFAFYNVQNQASLPTGLTKPSFAYEQDNGVLWYYNVFDVAWEKVGLVLS